TRFPYTTLFRSGQRFVTPCDGQRQTFAQGRVGRELVLQMADAEGDVARFILRDQQGDPARERIGRVTLEKPEQIQKRPFAQHRKQKRSEREIRLVQQRLEPLPPAHRGQSQFPSAQRG